jgi:osmotically-inducible protein OsmY
MKHPLLLLLPLTAFGCDASEDRASTSDRPGTTVPADNTERNARDREVAALTPADQGGSEADRTVTQRIRQGVVDSETLSVNGKNVKIITVDGVVTLRGPVASDEEKTQIATVASRVPGVKRVENQLEIAANRAAEQDIEK